MHSLGREGKIGDQIKRDGEKERGTPTPTQCSLACTSPACPPRVCECQNIPLLAFLLERAPLDPLPNLRDQKTPLHIACDLNNVDMAAMLMKVWPKLILEQEAKDKRTPLHTACHRCHRDVVLALLKGIPQLLRGEVFTEGSKLDLNIPDVDGNTPLHYACYNPACKEIVPELLAFRPNFANYVPFDANTANYDKGRTILHVAVSRKRSNCLVELLLQLPGSSIDRAAKAKPSGDTVRYLTKRVSRLARMQGVEQSNVAAAVLSESLPVGGGMMRCDSPLESHSSHVHTLSSVEENEEKEDSRLHQYSPAKHIAFSERPKKRTKSEVPDKDKVQPLLYIAPDGTLTLSPKGAEVAQNCRLFSELQLTPLVEACAMANEAVLRSLLAAGVRDREERYGAKILQSLHEDSMLQLLLSFHCKQVPLANEGESKMAASARAAMGLKLQWESAGLKTVQKEWLVGSAFHPVPEFLPMTLLIVPSVSADAISEVNLSRNRLTSLPVEFFQLPNLRTFNISANQLQSLPVSVPMDHLPRSVQHSGWCCLELRELDLSSNRLRELPQFVWKLQKLEKIMVSDNELEVLGRVVDQENLSPSLKHVDLSKNKKLKYVSNFLFQFENIARLNLSHNQLQSLPREMWSCVSLEELDVSHNQLRFLPSLDSLQQESLSSDSPSLVMGEHIFNPFGQVSLRPTKLIGGRATGRFIRPLHKDGEHNDLSLVQVHDPSRLRVLNLSNNALEVFPCALPCLAPNLQELNLEHNAGITEVDIACIPQQLKKLQLGHNKIRSFGRVLPSNERRTLRNQCHKPMEQTRVDCIHRRHQQLEQLERLDLSHNCLDKLPLLRKKPTRIEESLSLSRSVQLESVDAAKLVADEPWDPEEVASPNTTVDDLLYPKLRHLDLSNNNLTGHFNPNVGFLRSLQKINLSSNPRLTHLPAELAYLRRGSGAMKLNELNLSDLPELKEPPLKYQSVSLDQLMRYFRSQLKE